jgi:hypothetical protein
MLDMLVDVFGWQSTRGEQCTHGERVGRLR